MFYSKSFLKTARRSKQTTFEPSAVLPDDEGRVFVTDVPGAPVCVIGRLGRDGKWYIGQVGIESPHEEEQRECKARLEEVEARGIIVLRDEPVAEQMVRQGIRRLLGQPGLVFRDLFLARLRTSRFKDEERPQHHLDAAVASGILVERGEDGRLRAEGMTDYSEHFRIEQAPDGTWRVTDGAGEMFHGLPDEPTAWVMANYTYAIIDSKMRHDLH